MPDGLDHRIGHFRPLGKVSGVVKRLILPVARYFVRQVGTWGGRRHEQGLPDDSAERFREHSEGIPVLEWPHPTQDYQCLGVMVKGWSFSVVSSPLIVVSSSLSKFDFEGECFTTNSSLNGLKVYGKFESLISPRILLNSLPERWASMPHMENMIAEGSCQGWGRISWYGQTRSPTLPPTLSFTLFCWPGGLEWLYRAFLAAFVTSEYGFWPLCLDLTIAPLDAGVGASNDEPVEDFWREHWRSEPWRVVSWELEMRYERQT